MMFKNSVQILLLNLNLKTKPRINKQAEHSLESLHQLQRYNDDRKQYFI